MSLVSVLMPVYNAERYVAEAIESILAQTFTDFEFIIVDDGSTDGSQSILERYARQDPRIRLISRPNTGIVGALNDGLAEAGGKYVARMDADDRCRPDRFALQAEYLETHTDIVALGSYASMIDPNGRLLCPELTVPLDHEEMEASNLRGFPTMFHPAAMIRAHALKQIGGYRQEAWPAEDLDLWLRLGEAGRLANLPEPLFIWRRASTGIWFGTQPKHAGVIRRVLRDAWLRRKLSGDPPQYATTPQGKVDLWTSFAWIALKSGLRQTARLYALRVLFSRPWRLGSWRLAYCAARGR